MKKLSLENDYYSIVAFYFGEYANDKSNGLLTMDNIAVNCRTKQVGMPALTMVSDVEVILDIPPEPILRLMDVESYKNKLDLAYDSATELQKILRSYFMNHTDDGGDI